MNTLLVESPRMVAAAMRVLSEICHTQLAARAWHTGCAAWFGGGSYDACAAAWSENAYGTQRVEGEPPASASGTALPASAFMPNLARRPSAALA